MRQEASHATFPVMHPGFIHALTDEPILLDGMRVMFDERVGLYPVRLHLKETTRNGSGRRRRNGEA